MADEIAQLKSRLIAAWDDYTRDTIDVPRGGIRFQTLREPHRPRTTLAIGHSRIGRTGETRLEIRVSVHDRKSRQQVGEIAAAARAQGFDSLIRYFKKKPTIARPPAGAGGAAAAPQSVNAGWRRPLEVGASIAHGKGTAGTLGGFVRTASGDLAALSCTHVLAWVPRGKAKPGDPVYQPGPADMPIVPNNAIGKLTRCFAPLLPGQKNNLDAAVTSIDSGCAHADVALLNRFPMDWDVGLLGPDWITDKYRGRRFGALLPPEDIETETRVVKLGRSSGLTRTAIVSAIAFENLNVSLGNARSPQNFTFSSAIELQWDEGAPPFTEPGDSGAMILTDDEELRPIGLHFAASPDDRVSYVMPLKRICDTFKLSLA